MDLDARVDGSFARVDVNFQSVTVTYFCYVYIYFFHFDISVNTKVPLILHIKIQPNIPSHFGLKCQGRRNFFRVDVNFRTVIVTEYSHRYCFHFDINQHQGLTKIPYKISAKYT